jgi:hypothetical protein
MKNVKQIVVALIIITAAAITSCRKEAVPPPPAQASMKDSSETQLDGLIQAPKYRLSKQGNTYLHYLADGRLWRVIFSPTNYIEYSWGLNGVTATNFIDNKKYSTNTIMIKGHGKCYYSTMRLYKEGFVSSKWSWKYEYANNRLTKQVNPDDADERYEYSYNAKGNLEKIKYYNKQGVLTNTATYFFNDSGSWITSAEDKCPINPETVELERYLQLYGKFSDYLVKKIEWTFIPTNTLIMNDTFMYTLNDKGYVTKRQRFVSAKLQENTFYEYQQVR